MVRALAAEPSCAETVMVNRRAVPPAFGPRVRQVILDTADARFPAEVTELARGMVAQGDPVYGASCVGVGKGSLKWSEQDLMALEIGVVGGFARGCQAGGITQFALLSAVGSTPKSRYVAWLGRLIPGRFGTIEQDDIGRAFVAEFIEGPARNGTVHLENEAMRQRSRTLS